MDFKALQTENGIIADKRNKGFAIEAATGILNWAFDQ